MPRTAATYVDACMHSKDHELGYPKHWKSKFEILKSDFFFHDRYRVVLVACTYSWARYTPMNLSILLSPNTVRVTKHSDHYSAVNFRGSPEFWIFGHFY